MPASALRSFDRCSAVCSGWPFLGGQGKCFRGAGAAAAAFVATAVIGYQAVRPGPLAHADRAAFAVVRARRRPAGVVAARAVSALAEPGVTYSAAALTGVVASRRTGSWRAAVPLLAIWSGAAVRRRVSRVIGRSRPPSTAWLVEPEGFSLPSKHTTVAALAAGACARTFSTRSHGYLASTVAALLVGGSRVYLGVHWPSDVLAGWLFAVGWLRLTDPG
jgi:membrane-associated phospholipid phosphatase